MKSEVRAMRKELSMHFLLLQRLRQMKHLELTQKKWQTKMKLFRLCCDALTNGHHCDYQCRNAYGLIRPKNCRVLTFMRDILIINIWINMVPACDWKKKTKISTGYGWTFEMVEYACVWFHFIAYCVSLQNDFIERFQPILFVCSSRLIDLDLGDVLNNIYYVQIITYMRNYLQQITDRRHTMKSWSFFFFSRFIWSCSLRIPKRSAQCNR